MPALLLRRSALLVAIAGLGLSLPAHAIPVVEIVFTSTTGAGTPGGTSIQADAGDVLGVEIRLTAGAAGLSSYGVSLEFDRDLGDELELASAPIELLPDGFDLNLTAGVESTQESTGAELGSVLTFEAFALGDGPVDATFAIGRLELLVTTGVAADGADLFAGLFNAGVDGLFDNAGADVSGDARFETANVPEPRPLESLLLAFAAGLVARHVVRADWDARAAVDVGRLPAGQ